MNYIGSREQLRASCSMAERHVSLLKSFATGNVSEWLTWFEICSNANGWNNERKAVKLPPLLEGAALALWLEESEKSRKTIKSPRRNWY